MKADIAVEREDPAVAGLDYGAFGPDDLLNLVLQRSEVLHDQTRPGEVIRAWNAGDEGPIRAAVAALGPEIARRAAAVIHAEYKAMADRLGRLRPKRVADIGCGYAIFDLFVARDLKADLLLIDLEQNDRRHFGFQSEGAAYSNLDTARRFLETNGVAPGRICTLNPGKEDPVAAGPVGLAFSFLSCGFHFPVDLYMPFFERAVTPTGTIVLDLRERTAEAQRATLSPLGRIEVLDSPYKAQRILLKKGRD